MLHYVRMLLVLSLVATACRGSEAEPDSNTPADASADAGTGGPDGSVTGPDSSSGTFFLDLSSNFVEPSIATDADGGVHVAYRAYTSVDGKYPVRYAYCASRCGEADSWIAFDIGLSGIGGAFPSLALDAAGRPHVAWFRSDDWLGSDGAFWLARCEAGCSQPASWTAGEAFQTEALSPEGDRYFGIDPGGSAVIVHRGASTALFASCTQGCTDAAGWRQTDLSIRRGYNFAVAFAGPGKPRFAFTSEGDLYYFECGGNCGDASSWSGGGLFGIGSGGRFDLRTDRSGRPRIALYEGYLADAPQNEKTYYAWCDSGCSAASAWSSALVDVPDRFGEEGLALVMDADDRPWIAGGIDDYMQSLYGVGIAICDQGCESDGAQWRSVLVASVDDLEASDPVPVASGCSISVWNVVGKDVSLSLDPAGQPRLAYGATHGQGGSCSVHDDLALIRLTVLASD